MRVLSIKKINHVYRHSFRSIIKATEKFPGVGAFDHLGHLNSFSASGGGKLNKNFPKIQMSGGLPGGGMLKLRFDWYITLACVRSFTSTSLSRDMKI